MTITEKEDFRGQIEEVASGIRSRVEPSATHKVISTEDAGFAAETLQENQNLQVLNLNGCVISDQDAANLLLSLKGHPTLEIIYMVGAGLGPKSANAIAELIENNSSLKNLYLGTNHFNATDGIRIAEALKAENGIQDLFLSNNPAMGDKAGWAFAEALKTNKILTSIDLGTTGMSESVRAELEDALAESCSKNIVRVAGFGSGKFRERCAENGEIASNLLNKLKDVSQNSGIVRDKPPETFELKDFQQLSQRLPAVVYQGKHFHKNIVAIADGVLDEFPVLETVALEKLVERNAQELTPLDNWRTYENFQEICKVLAEKGTPLTLDFLASHQSRNGKTFLENCLRGAPTRDFIAGLNASGQQVRAAYLLNEDGSPSPVFKGLMEDGDIRELFTEANWLGATPREMRTVLGKMPEELQEKIPNKQSLAASLGRNCQVQKTR